MTARLREKVALITGAGSGIGRGCAVRLAAEGARVVIGDLERSAGLETLTQIQRNGGKAIFQNSSGRRVPACHYVLCTTRLWLEG